MKSVTAIFLLSVSAHLALAQRVAQPRVTTADLYQVRFIDRNNGWAIGQYFTRNGTVLLPANKSSVLRTTDAGNSWSERVLNNFLLRGLTFVNRLGWAAGTTPSGKGLICKTDDGDLWHLVDSGATRTHYTAIQFLDELHGWVGGWNDTAYFVMRTANGGVTWQTAYDKSLDVNALFFLDTLKGWDVGENGKIYKTTDGGATWQSAFQAPDPYSPLSGSPLKRIRFIDPMHGHAVGGLGGGETKVWTSDGGATWNLVNKTQGSSLRGVCFTDTTNGWCVGGANAGLTIQKTTDGGKTWVKQQFPALAASVTYFEDIAFVSPTEGWIVADSGYILKTTNGGQPVTFVANQLNGTPAAFQLSQNYPNPFNPATTISFSLPSGSFVTLKVFDALGREVSSLLAEELPAGTHSRQWNASEFPSGVYYYRLQARSFNETRKLVLLR